jgi:hypothetical protein
VKVSKVAITIYQNITVKFNGEEITYSECWTYNTTKSVVDEFHMPKYLFENEPNFRYQALAECWFELGSPDPSYKPGSLLDDGADPKTPWGRAKGRWDLREVPENASPIRRETILLWSSGIMHEPIEIRRSGPVSNCHLFENFHGKRERLSCCTFGEYVRRKRQRNNSIFATALDKQSHQHFSAAVAEFDPSLTVYKRTCLPCDSGRLAIVNLSCIDPQQHIDTDGYIYTTPSAYFITTAISWPIRYDLHWQTRRALNKLACRSLQSTASAASRQASTASRQSSISCLEASLSSPGLRQASAASRQASAASKQSSLSCLEASLNCLEAIKHQLPRGKPQLPRHIQ